ncbi:hypothetical protein M2372_002028 [Chryseobacterium sp. BIGb0232]|nr:hypothetical protein [Chryseobacterium sp. BIGb0232]ROS17238.1 hypothetical protein EDF65_1601 [Chryseobacterium nakagawai]
MSEFNIFGKEFAYDVLIVSISKVSLMYRSHFMILQIMIVLKNQKHMDIQLRRR